MDKGPSLDHLRSLIALSQKSRWEEFGFSPEWSFELRPMEVEGENARKYLATFFSKGGKVERELFVKQYHHPEIGRQAVENEFQGLRIAHRAFQNSRSFRAPRPYGRFLEERVLFMERCPSLPLKEVLFKPLRFSRFLLLARDREALLARIAEAGELLRAFQEIPPEGRPVDHEKRTEEILMRYERHFLRHLGRCRRAGLPEKLSRRIEESVLDRMKKAAGRGPLAPRIVLQHSDFAPWNLLVGKGRLYLTDFQNFTTGFSSYDAAFFYTALGLLFRYRTLDRPFLARLRARFLRSFMKDEEAPLPLFKVFELTHMAYFAPMLLRLHRGPFYEPIYAVPYRRFIIDWFDRNLEEENPSPLR